MPVIMRDLLRDQIAEVWNIDRREYIENVYRLKDGALVLEPHNFQVPGWPPGEAEKDTPIFLDCFDRGGWLHGAFDNERLVGVAILDSRFIGNPEDQLQLKFLHVSRSFRKQGLGSKLFELAKLAARQKGAKRLYISATRSENTVNFYMRLGCTLVKEPDPELFVLEPVDIHLEMKI